MLNPCPNGLPTPQIMLGPSSVLDPCPAGIPDPWAPHPSGPAGPQLLLEQPEPRPTRIPTHQSLLDPCSAWIPIPWAEPALSSIGLPDNQASAQAATRELQTCLRNTHRQDRMLKE
jgi:hypothetical protein